MPQKGDLAVISKVNEQPAETCRAIFELFYGEEEILDRLESFLKFVNDFGLPQKWTFPTYYLFLLYPENEIFVKPSVMRWLSKEFDGAMTYSSKPNAATYIEMRQVFHSLKDVLRGYGARDMIAEKGYDPVYGARPLKRVIQQFIENPLSMEILKGTVPEGSRVQAEAVDDRIAFTRL